MGRHTALKAKAPRSKAIHAALEAVTTMNDDYDILINGPASKRTPPRWVCYHRDGETDIDAWVWNTNHMETIATIRSMKGVSARVNAEFIVGLVNDYDNIVLAFRSALSAIDELRTCAADRLTFTAEHESEIAERKIRKLLGAVVP